MHPTVQESLPGYAQRHETWDEITAVSSIGRRTMGAVPNYRLLRAATQIDATAASRLLLVHLIGYLGPDDQSRPEQRFVVFPGNTRLSDELRCTPRSIQRQADELESKGFMRRCYNAMNRRTGFDLTPFAMQHEDVVAAMVAVHTRRRQEREESQLELSLEADRIERPERVLATSVSSQGDTGVALNRTGHIRDDGSKAASDALDAFDATGAATSLLGIPSDQDRTGVQHDAILAHVTASFASGGRLSSLGWATALQSLGRNRAIALYLVAATDPRRRQSAERYFGWLLRMASEGTHDVVVQAATRASKAMPAPSRASDGSIGAAISNVIDLGAMRAPRAAQAKNEGRKAPKSGSTKRADTIVAEDSATHGIDGSAIAAPAAVSGTGDRLPASVPDRRARDWSAAVDDRGMHEIMRGELGARLYDTWVSRTRCGMDGGVLVVTAPSAFAAQWIERNLATAMGRAAGRREGREIEVLVRTLS